ncbi:unnamed protein product [Heterobilharzia americana]|nr:unnamed protein product [Heterobilharzia americana]
MLWPLSVCTCIFRKIDHQNSVSMFSGEILIFNFPRRCAFLNFPLLVEVICAFYPNGNISIYFEEIPKLVDDSLEDLMITDGSEYPLCDEDEEYCHRITYSEIEIPESMIKSNTLVEFSPNSST